MMAGERGEVERVERLRRAYALREGLPEGIPECAECEDSQHAREAEPQQDRHENRFRSALCERRGATIRPARARARTR